MAKSSGTARPIDKPYKKALRAGKGPRKSTMPKGRKSGGCCGK